MGIIKSALAYVTGLSAEERQERAREEALKGAYRSMIQRHPHAPKIGFDWHFINNWAEYLFEPFIVGGLVPNPKAVAGAWAEQFAFNSGQQQDAFTQVLPLATDLIYILETEIECTIPTVGTRLAYAM